MHRTRHRWIAVLLWAAVVTPALAGCGVAPASPSADHATAYAVQGSAHALAPELGDAERARLTALAEDPDTDDVVAHVVGSGDDVVDVDLEPRRPNGDIEHGPDRIKTLVAGRLDALQATIHEVSARVRDDRPLDQLAAAARTGAGTLVLLHAGLTTTDPLDMRVSGWDADPTALAEDLRARTLLPELEGRDVIVSGLARTTGRQPPVNLAERAALHDRWTALCEATGARCRVDDTLRPPTPPVSTLDGPVVDAPPVPTLAGPVWSVPAPVLFRPNDCAITDPRAAAEILAPLTARLKQGTRVIISGRTAPVGGDGRDLALCRARAVAAVLQGEGAPQNSIADVRGDGSTADPPEASRDAQGRLDPTKLAALRRVVFTLTDETGGAAR